MVARTRLYTTLHVRCLSCYKLDGVFQCAVAPDVSVSFRFPFLWNGLIAHGSESQAEMSSCANTYRLEMRLQKHLYIEKSFWWRIISGSHNTKRIDVKAAYLITGWRHSSLPWIHCTVYKLRISFNGTFHILEKLQLFLNVVHRLELRKGASLPFDTPRRYIGGEEI